MYTQTQNKPRTDILQMYYCSANPTLPVANKSTYAVYDEGIASLSLQREILPALCHGTPARCSEYLRINPS